MIKFGMALMEMVEQLTKGYIKATGKQPGNLEKLKIQEEAIKRFKDMNKVVDMKGNPINPAEGILGGQQAQNFSKKLDPALYEDRGGNIIPAQFDESPAFPSYTAKETEEQIRQRLLKNNKDGIASMKSKLDDPEKKADGGRAGFVGGGMGRRGFLKLLGGVGAGIGALKSGILGFGGKKAGTEVAKKVAKEAATSGAPPPHFLKLVAKIKALGDDAPKLAVKDREVVTKYKDYTLTEDVTTGEKTIQRMKIDDDLKYDASEYYGKPVGEEVYMSYRPGKGQADETMKGKTPLDEYTEDTSLIRGDRPAEGEVMETVSGVPDDIFLEVGEEIPEIIRKTKADGGRIGYQIGGDVAYDSTDSIYGSSAATFTPDTVMDAFGNQVQAQMGNSFNKPLIPQVTADKNLSQVTPPKTPISMQTPLSGIPAAGGGLKATEIDMPIAGGINNAGGILPVMPQEDNSFITQPGFPDSNGDGIDDRLSDEEKERRLNPVGGGKLEEAQYNNPLPQDQLMSGFEQYKKNNPEVMQGAGTLAIIPVTLPGGYDYTFSGSLEANAFNKYLESIGQAPAQAQQNKLHPIASPRTIIGGDGSGLSKLANGGRIGAMYGGRIGYKIGSSKKGVQSLLDLIRNKFGKESITTADKIPLPNDTLKRNMFDAANKRFNKSTTPESEKIVGDILEDTDINDLFDADGKLNKDAVLKAATSKDVDKEILGQYSPENAVDDIFPSGDYKYDADIAAEAYVENNPQMFKNMLYEDLDDRTRSEVYSKVLAVINQRNAKMLQTKRNAKSIDISNDSVAEDFTNFIKKTDPDGFKKLEQRLLLENAKKPKNRKLNASGGLAAMLGE